jgi:hypothetical protein
MIAGLPLEGQYALFDLVGRLREAEDPYALSEPYGIDDGVTRQASFGHGIAVFLFSADDRRMTLIQIAKPKT